VTDPQTEAVLAKYPPIFRAMLAGTVMAVAPATRPLGEQPGQGEPPPHNPQEEEALEGIRGRMVEAHDRMEAIRARADAEHRRITDEEAKELDDLSDQFDGLDDEVKRRERLIGQRDRLNAPRARVTQPGDLQRDGQPQAAGEPGGRPRITGGDYAGAAKNSWGWRSWGEYAKGVAAAAQGRVDPRLTAAATTYGSEGSNPDGGFAIPPDFRETIIKKVQAEDGLLARTDQQQTSSNKMTVPVDTATPWQTSGGIQVYWENEGPAMTGSKPALEQLEVKANRANCLVPVTEELLEDVPALSRYLPNKVGDKFTSKINDAIIAGDGVGKLQGLLKAGSLVSVAKESGQAAATLNYTNVVKMWSRMYAPLRPGAIWLVNQDIEPQLLSMVVPGTQPSWPAYMPPGGLSGAPYGTLLGRPVIAQEGCSTLGTQGDIILTNLSQYLTVQKVGGVRADVSMHVYFEQNMQAFRFILRIGGQSWWKAAITRKNGGNTLSNIVVLDDR
jgi:HK97 family phage major capsid protein